jgi:hypothetical protein
MKYLFVIPEYNSFVSGGNHYNKNFIQAISALAPFQTTTWENFRPINEPNTVTIIDSIYIDQIEPDNVNIKNESVLLLHYLDIFYDKKSNDALITKRLQQLLAFKYFIATGQFTYDWLIRAGVNKENIFLLTPVIQIQGSKKHNDPGTPKRLLMVGNLLPVKGYIEFLTALELQKPADIFITIVGDKKIDPSYSTSMLNLIEVLPYLKKTCSVEETVPHESMPALFEKNDLMISSSFFETFGMSVHEALYSGLPVWAISAGNIINIRHPLLRTFENHNNMASALHNFNKYEIEQETKNNETKIEDRSWIDLALQFHARFA